MKKLFNVICFFTAIVFFNACNKVPKSIQCESKPTMFKSLFFQSKDISFAIENFGLRAIRNEIDSIEIGNHPLESMNYTKIKDFVNALSQTPINSIVTVFYIDSFASKTSSLNSNNIHGFSVFSKAGELYHHRLFISTQGTFQEVTELATDTYVVSFNTLLNIQKKVLHAENNKRSLIMTFNKGAEFPKKITYVDQLEKKVQTYVSNGQETKGNRTSNTLESAPMCNSCYPITYGKCIADYNNPPYYQTCQMNKCGSGAIMMIMDTETNMSSDSLNLVFNNNLHYQFRDSLLDRTEFGVRYIDYYYDLSKIYDGKYSVGDAIATTYVLAKFNSRIQLLLSPSGHENEQFLSSDLKNDLLELISRYKVLYSDEYTERIFYGIINDINNVQSKTVSQVLQEKF